MMKKFLNKLIKYGLKIDKMNFNRLKMIQNLYLKKNNFKITFKNSIKKYSINKMYLNILININYSKIKYI